MAPDPAASKDAEDVGTPTPPLERRRRRRVTRYLLWGLEAVVLVAAVALILTGRLHRTHSVPTTGSSATTAPVPKPAFTFRLAIRSATMARRGSASQAQPAAEAVRASLNRFYQASFLDPKAWEGQVAPVAWDAFGPAVRPRAQADASSLTIGHPGAGITALDPTTANLVVHVLLDQNGHATAAFADVTFAASGALKGGGPVQVENTAHFYLRPSDGAWVITGYVGAATDVRSGAATSPSPGASP